MGAYAQNTDHTFHTSGKVQLTRKRGGALEKRLKAFRGGRVVIDYSNNTFTVVPAEEEQKHGQLFV